MKTNHPGRTALLLSALVLTALAVSCQPTPPVAGGPAPAAGAPAGAPAAGAPAQGQGQGQAGGQGGGQRPGGPGGFGGGRNTVVPVQVATVTFGPLVASNTSAGAVSPETQSSVAAGTNGTVKTIVRKAGEWVRTGEVVVQLDDSQLRLSLQLAQTALQNAVVNAGFDETGKPSPGSTIALKIQYAQSDVLAKQKNYEADQQLLKIGGVTQATLDNDVSAIQNSQATLESLKASVQQSTMAVQTATLQLQQAQLNLANAAIKAPFDGQIAAVNVHPGEYVGTSTAVFVLASRQKILTFTVPPSDAPGLSNRTPVKFTYNGQDYGATITQIPAAPVGGLIPLTASLPVDLSPPLGTVGTIVYTVELARGALVPLQAVQSAENTTFVFTVSKANKVAKSQVTILAETGAFAAVTGVPVGATVILNPPPGILVGSTVQPQAVADAQAAPPAGAAKAPAGAPGQRQGQGKRDASAVPGAPGAAPEAAGAPGGVPGQRQGQGQGAYTGQRRQGTSAPPPAGAPAAAPAPSGGQ